LEIETFEVKPHIILSTPQAMRLPLRWIAILHGRISANLAASGGIHEAQDVVKMIMAGADITMLCSVLLKHGIGKIAKLEQGLVELMENLEYATVSQMRGCVSFKNCQDPSMYERALYIKGLKSYHSP
jgi:dihydroorotate dehydrogenase (fumarate)